ncbi:MAG: RagB/SusD family nutrient uptake outer membrane protein [Bacteroidota bacterium]
MKKYKYISFLFVIALILTVTSCEDFVERYPRSAVASEEALSTMDGIEGALAGLYSRMTNGGYNQREMNIAGEILSDQMDIAQQNAGRMIYHATNQEGAGFGVWSALYNNINRCNMILHYIDEVEAAENRVNQAKGEAYALRAHLYFDLLRIYARPYMYQEPLVQGEPLGVIIKTEPFLGIDENTFQSRGTIEEGYQQVLDDLSMALNYLEGDEGFPYRYNEVSAKAMLARLHLYMGNWSEAASYAEDVIAEAPIGLVDAADGVDYIVRVFANRPGEESVLEFGFANETVAPSMNYSVAGMATYYDEQVFADRGIVMPHMVIDYEAYGDVILRRDLVENIMQPYAALGDVRGEENATYYERDKGGQWCAFQAKYHSYRGVANWDDIKVIRISEMYFIAAEAYAEMDQLGPAEDMLIEVREHRGIGSVPITATTKEEFIDLLLTEKRLEFFSEMSHRWFDLRRRGMDIPKGIDGLDQGTTVDFEDYRIVERIPVSEIEANENCVQNPGY